MDFIRDNPGEPVPEETFTHSHQSWSSIIPYLLHPSATIHGILQSLFNPHAWQSFPQSLSKFSLVYLLAWHPPLHTPYISSPNHCLFATHAYTITTWFAVVPRLCHLILVSLSTITWYGVILGKMNLKLLEWHLKVTQNHQQCCQLKDSRNRTINCLLHLHLCHALFWDNNACLANVIACHLKQPILYPF